MMRATRDSVPVRRCPPLGLCRARLPAPRELRGESGHTIAETAVALALFVFVLVPLGGGLALFLTRHSNEHLVQASLVGQEVLERALADDSLEPGSSTEHQGPWTIERNICDDAGLVTLTVTVYPPRQTRALFALTTMRVRLPRPDTP